MTADRSGSPSGASGVTVDPRRYAREITSLLALPALWSGREPSFLIQTLFEALESVWRLDAAYGAVSILHPERLEILRAAEAPLDPADTRWAPLIHFAMAAPGEESIADLDVPLHGLVRAVRLPIGYAGETGCLALASRQPGFPDATDRALLHAAVGLTASALENARLLRQRDEAQRAKDEFLAMLGHELRNPLAPIVTALGLMALRAGGRKSREQEIIERQVKHLRTLVDDLLDVSRIVRGKVELQIEPIDIAEIVGRAVETVAPLVAAHRHRLETGVPRGMIVEGDPTRLTQVVANLLTNAVKYTPPGGDIRIRAEQADGGYTVRVLDTGMGIAPELRAVIFDLFVQGRRSAARPEGGLGIGLTLVKRLVELHGGTVAVRSDGPGLGSEFAITLPAAPHRAGARQDAADRDAPHEPAARPVRILVVDDNRDAAELAVALLAGHGHQVEMAHTGAAALEMMAKQRPAVVVLDIGLPDLDGYALAAQAKAIAPVPPLLIALTGYGQPGDRARSREAGIDAHLVKPVDPRVLLATIHSAIANAGDIH